MNWFLAINGQTRGPLPLDEVKRLAAGKEIGATTLAWKEGMPGWQKVADIAELAALISVGAAPRPTAPAPQPATVQPASAPTPQPAEDQPVPAPASKPEARPMVPIKPKAKDEVPNKVDQLVEWAKGPIQEEGLCPSCGYYVGAGFVCPRCGGRTEKRMSVRLIKVGSLIGSFVGLLLLWMAATAKAPQPVNIGDIDIAMNGALVEVHGRITDYQEDKAKDSLRMKVDDGTGQISVSLFGKLKAFKDFLGDKMPGPGDEVEITGTINETQSFGVSLFISIPERLKLIKHYKVREAKLGLVNSLKLGDIVKVRARITKVQKKKSQSTGSEYVIITIADETGEATSRLFSTQLEQFTPATAAIFAKKSETVYEMLLRIAKLPGGMKPEVEFIDFGAVKPMVEAPAPEDADEPAAPAAAGETEPAE